MNNITFFVIMKKTYHLFLLFFIFASNLSQ